MWIVDRGTWNGLSWNSSWNGHQIVRRAIPWGQGISWNESWKIKKKFHDLSRHCQSARHCTTGRHSTTAVSFYHNRLSTTAVGHSTTAGILNGPPFHYGRHSTTATIPSRPPFHHGRHSTTAANPLRRVFDNGLPFHYGSHSSIAVIQLRLSVHHGRINQLWRNKPNRALLVNRLTGMEWVKLIRNQPRIGTWLSVSIRPFISRARQANRLIGTEWVKVNL